MNELLDYTDYDSARSELETRVRDAVSGIGTENDAYTLGVRDVHYFKQDKIPLRDQKKALLEDRSLNRRLVGKWVLTDKLTGKAVTTKQRTLMNVPYLTDRGTFIRNGTEYVVAKQFRLSPGIYTRITDDGNVEAQFNAEPRSGPSFRVYLEPATSVFFLNYKNRKIPLYPVLRGMGYPTDQLKTAWGAQIFDANKATERSPYAVNFLRQFQNREQLGDEIMTSLGVQKAAAEADYSDELRDNLLAEFGKTRLHPRTTEITMGKPFETVTPDALAAASMKTLRISQGKEDTDSRDSLEFQDLYDVSDFLPEKIKNDQQGVLARMLWRLTGKQGDVSKIPPSLLDKHVQHLFYSTGLGQAVEEINPLDMLDQNQKVIRLGEGAMSSVDVVPKEARGVHPSHLGYIDPIRSPECYSADTEVMTRLGWKRWEDVTAADDFACLLEGRLEYHKAKRMMTYWYEGEMIGAQTSVVGFLVTPNHRMWVRPIAVKPVPQYRFEIAESVLHKNRVVQSSHLPLEIADPVTEITIPAISSEGVQVKGNPPIGAHRVVLEKPVPMSIWAPFMGWFLSEGCACVNRKTSSYVVDISQSKTANPASYEQIRSLLARSPFPYTELSKQRGFRIAFKQLAVYLKQFGYCYDKWIPDEIFKASLACREAFVEAALAGDGRKGVDGKPRMLCTTSKKLALDFQRLLFEMGKSSTLYFEPDDREERYLGCWCVYIHTRPERAIYCKNHRHQDGQYFTQQYNGIVYCAEVPGGLLYVKRQSGCGFWCGNSLKIGVDSRFSRNVRRGPDHEIYTKLWDPRAGKAVWVGVRDATRKTVAFSDMLSNEDRFVPAIVKSREMTYVPRDKVDYVIPDGDDMFSIGANLVPLKSGVKGMRLLMGSKFAVSALPLVEREAPLVQTFDAEHGSTERRVSSHLGAIRSPVKGTVSAVYADHIDVVDPRGEKHRVDIYDNHPYMRKSYIRNIPEVRAGQSVAAGDLLASSNYTDPQGTAALGKNLRVAYWNYDGKVFEDAVVISETAAKKLTSEHLYPVRMDTEPDLRIGKEGYRTMFPARFNAAQLKTVDDSGVVKSGTVLHYGDPMFLAFREREPSPGSMRRRTRVEEAVTWQHPFPGVVTDAVKSKGGYHVNIRANLPTQIGDKLSNRLGGKGVVSDIIRDSEMPFDSKGRPIDVILSPLGVISRCYDEATEFLTEEGWKKGDRVQDGDRLACFHPETETVGLLPQAAPFYCVDYKGGMIRAISSTYDFLVTPNHKMWAKQAYSEYCPWKEIQASELLRGERYVPTVAGPIKGVDFDMILVPRRNHVKNTTRQFPLCILAKDFAAFLGWYLSEGNTTFDAKSREYRVHIAQNDVAHPEHCEEIRELLNRLPFRWNYGEKNKQFHISSKTLAEYCVQFGKCDEKRIPDWVFQQSYDTRAVFLDALWKGDGSKGLNSRGSVVSKLGSRSEGLIDDVQRLLVYQGVSSRKGKVKTDPQDGPIWYVNVHVTKRRLIEKKNVRRILYSGKVYCPTVPTGYVVTRRNGCLLIAGNTNSAQKIEAQLGKVAEKTGKPYILPGFMPENMLDFVEAELKDNRLSDTENVTDPRTGKTIPDIFVGKSYFYKQQHTAEGKGKSRATAEYTAEEQPAKGGKTGAKHLGPMETEALLASGATDVLKDIKLIKGQRNDDFWRQIKLGQTPVMPGTPLVYDKFRDYIRASGVQLRESRHADTIFAMKDSDVKELTGNRRIEKPTTYGAQSLRPLPGGLFDPDATGSMAHGDRWSYIQLPEPMPNPIMEDPLRVILGMTKKQFEATVSGQLDADGKPGESLVDKLKRFDPKTEKNRALEDIKFGVKSKRDDAVKRYRYLDAMDQQGAAPMDFMMTRVPVLPPRFRPITRQNKMTMVADPNYMYKSLLESIEDYRDAQPLTKTEQDQARLQIYRNYKSLVGITDPDQAQLQEKGVQGILSQIFGKGSPKYGMVQRRVLGTNIDLTGLGVVTPNPSLNLNEVGLPEELAWGLYEPFIVRTMVRNGYPAIAASKAVTEHAPVAYEALRTVIRERPVLINRAPTLHKYSITAAWPVLTKGHTLQVPPAIVKPLGMDFDGDDCYGQVLVNLSPKAKVLLESRHGVAFLEARRYMYTKTSVIGMQGKEIYLFDLEDFPHGELSFRKEGKKGPIEFYGVLGGVRVLSYDENSGNLLWADVSGWSKHFDREVEIVTTDTGYQVFTDDDPRAVYGVGIEDMRLIRATPSEALKQHILIPRQKTFEAEVSHTSIRTEDYRCIGDLLNISRHMSLKAELPLDAAFGYVLGAFIGDGWVAHDKGERSGQVCLAGTDETIFKKVDAGICGLFEKQTPEMGRINSVKTATNGRYGDCSRVVWSSGKLAELLEPLIGCGAKNKHLPPFYLTAPLEFRQGLFAGLMDTDGTICVCHSKKKPQMSSNFMSTSFRLVYEVRWLAASLGISARVSRFKYRKTSTAWLLTFSAVDLQRWDAAEMTVVRKIEALRKTPVAADSNSASRNSRVPFPKSVHQDATKWVRDLFKTDNGLYGAVHDGCRQNCLSQVMAKRLISRFKDRMSSEEWRKWLRIVSQEDITWEKIEAVEKTRIRETGYDLTVPGYETFVTHEGIVLSNTASYSVPVSSKAVSQAIELMMPEKRLLSARNDKPTYMPSNEYMQGMYFASKPAERKPVQTFRIMADAMQAFRRGDLRIDDPIRVGA